MSIFSLMPERQMRALCAALAAGLVICWAAQWGTAQQNTGEALRADTLRLHVRAASDTVADQTIKLRIRDTVLELADKYCPHTGKADALAWAAQNLPRIELRVRCTLAALGAEPLAGVRLVNMYFGTSRYTGTALPAGRYDAVRIELGDRRHCGKNWWCVLYPSLCRTACGGYAEPEENDLVCGEYILRFAAVDWWQRHTAARGDMLILEL